MITLLTTGNPIGSVVTKSNWLTNDFEICDEQGNVHFFIKSKEKIFSASEYPVNKFTKFFYKEHNKTSCIFCTRLQHKMDASWVKLFEKELQGWILPLKLHLNWHQSLKLSF